MSIRSYEVYALEPVRVNPIPKFYTKKAGPE